MNAILNQIRIFVMYMQLRELMVCLETGDTVKELPKVDETKDSSVLPVLEESTLRSSDEGDKR